MIIRTLPTPLNLHVLFAPWYIPLPEPWPLTPVGHMHLFTLYDIIKATSPMSLIASLVASSNLFCIILYLSIVVLFAGNKSTTTTTSSVKMYFIDYNQWLIMQNTHLCITWNAFVSRSKQCERHVVALYWDCVANKLISQSRNPSVDRAMIWFIKGLHIPVTVYMIFERRPLP